MTRQTIYLQPDAPRKPALGERCNGCGICCLAEPCPLGVLLSGKRSGACHALRWDPTGREYRCGAVTDPAGVLRDRLPAVLGWVALGLQWPVRWGARRWIAAGTGCDSTLEPAAPQEREP